MSDHPTSHLEVGALTELMRQIELGRYAVGRQKEHRVFRPGRSTYRPHLGQVGYGLQTGVDNGPLAGNPPGDATTERLNKDVVGDDGRETSGHSRFRAGWRGRHAQHAAVAAIHTRYENNGEGRVAQGEPIQGPIGPFTRAQ